MQNYLQVFYQYRKAAGELEAFETSDAFFNMKGYLQFKREKRTYKDKEYFYTNAYYTRVNYVNGIAERDIRYVKKAEVEEYKRKQTEKKENRRKYKELTKKVKRLRRQLKKYMKNKEDVFEEIENHRKTHEDFRENEKGVVSALGEMLRSRVECIVANLAFTFQILYQYEPVIKLYDGILHPDFFLFLNSKTILLEVLGMYGDSEYKRKWEQKEKTYRKNGYIIGKNMVCIACTDSKDINSQKIAQLLFNLKNGLIPQRMIYV